MISLPFNFKFDALSSLDSACEECYSCAHRFAKCVLRCATRDAARKSSREPGGEVDLNQPSTERRRSERVPESLPLVVRGIDLLGQPFEERTTTLAFNLHGCRYTSKHHLPRNTWVTLEIPQSVAQGVAQGVAPGNSRSALRARVAWVQRPHSIRDFFQIAVELESPANIWGHGGADWTGAVVQAPESTAVLARSIPRLSERAETDSAAGNLRNFMDHNKPEARNESRELHAAGDFAREAARDASPQAESAPAADNPLLRELRAELDRQAKDAVLSAAEQAREEVLQTAAATANERRPAPRRFFRIGRARSRRCKPARGRNFSRRWRRRKRKR